MRMRITDDAAEVHFGLRLNLIKEVADRFQTLPNSHFARNGPYLQTPEGMGTIGQSRTSGQPDAR